MWGGHGLLSYRFKTEQGSGARGQYAGMVSKKKHLWIGQSKWFLTTNMFLCIRSQITKIKNVQV